MNNNYLLNPDSPYCGSPDSDPLYENSFTHSLSSLDGSIDDLSEELVQFSRRAWGKLGGYKWILKSLDLGIKREFTLWWNKNYIRQGKPAEILTDFDDFNDPYEDLEGESIGVLLSKSPNQIPRISGHIARLCRLEIYVSDKPTKAEVIVNREWIVRYMNSRNIRKSVQSAILPYALKFSLIPTRDEVRARELTLQPEYQERLDSQQPLYSRGRKWLFNWLGRKIQEPVERSD